MMGRRCCRPCASWGHGAIGHGPFRVRRLGGVSHDQRLRRTAELMIGVAVGITVAEPLIGFSALGRGRVAVLVATLLPGRTASTSPRSTPTMRCATPASWRGGRSPRFARATCCLPRCPSGDPARAASPARHAPRTRWWGPSWWHPARSRPPSVGGGECPVTAILHSIRLRREVLRNSRSALHPDLKLVFLYALRREVLRNTRGRSLAHQKMAHVSIRPSA